MKPTEGHTRVEADGPLAGLVHLSFEVGTTCNLAHLHPKCPVSQPGRWPDTTAGPLSTADMVAIIDAAEALGFRGYVGFHYYNEPLLDRDRILEVVDASTYSRFMLWTNGLLLSEEVQENGFLLAFEWVMVSVYEPSRDGTRFAGLARHYPHTRIECLPAQLDDRLTIYRRSPGVIAQCRRPALDLPIDYFGNIHLCCQDWMGTVEIGNVKRNPLHIALARSNYFDLVEGIRRARGDMPAVCRGCGARVSEDHDLAYRERYWHSPAPHGRSTCTEHHSTLAS